MNCDKNCGGCSGCAGSLELTAAEAALLGALAQYSFLPVARKASDMTPVYLEDDAFSREEYSLILQCLEKKGLILLDYAKPLAGADMSAYRAYPVWGSMGLTQRGWAVVELMETLGLEE